MFDQIYFAANLELRVKIRHHNISKFLTDQLLQGEAMWSSFSLSIQECRCTEIGKITVAQDSFPWLHSQCESDLETALQGKLWELSQVISSPSNDYYNTAIRIRHKAWWSHSVVGIYWYDLLTYKLSGEKSAFSGRTHSLIFNHLNI